MVRNARYYDTDNRQTFRGRSPTRGAYGSYPNPVRVTSSSPVRSPVNSTNTQGGFRGNLTAANPQYRKSSRGRAETKGRNLLKSGSIGSNMNGRNQSRVNQTRSVSPSRGMARTASINNSSGNRISRSTSFKSGNGNSLVLKKTSSAFGGNNNNASARSRKALLERKRSLSLDSRRGNLSTVSRSGRNVVPVNCYDRIDHNDSIRATMAARNRANIAPTSTKGVNWGEDVEDSDYTYGSEELRLMKLKNYTIKTANNVGKKTVELTESACLGLGKSVEEVIENGLSALLGTERIYSWDEEDNYRGRRSNMPTMYWDE
mmetsp:Transcript_34470/g.79680  ORF Transcript_34470/g.79680 Transcript_34470/m.79680 type:complete len:317 (-) Transcript_34470:357-1307(-)